MPAASGPIDRYAPITPEFLHWQCRQAAHVTLETFETIAGPLKAWAPGVKKKLSVFPDAGQDLNAYYDRASLSFFEYPTGSSTTYSGASTDVVAHETGHAILDALRPELWDSVLPEHGAFHEAFGDCMALLTAFGDEETRRTLLARAPDLGKANFVEATAEDLSAGVRAVAGPKHPASAPRRAFNRYRWQLPSTLPMDGGPTVLTGEVHSFARVFTGCFYDTIRFIFEGFTKQSASTLWTAAQTAGALLIEGARQAVEDVRFFQAVGQAMVRADETRNSGANREAVQRAFGRHGIALGANAAVQERSRLPGATRVVTRRRAGTAGGFLAVLPSATLREVREKVHAGRATRLLREDVRIGGRPAVKLVHWRDVDLTGLSERLTGVRGPAPEPVLVGGIEGGYAAVLGHLPQRSVTEEEGRFFVATLLSHGAIGFDGAKKATGARRRTAHGAAAASRATSASLPSTATDTVTHVVRNRGGKRFLTRIRFTCGCRWGSSGGG